MSERRNVPYEETQYGFRFGAALVSRVCSDAKRGWVFLQVTTRKGTFDIYVTKTGKVRFTGPDGREWKP